MSSAEAISFPASSITGQLSQIRLRRCIEELSWGGELAKAGLVAAQQQCDPALPPGRSTGHAMAKKTYTSPEPNERANVRQIMGGVKSRASCFPFSLNFSPGRA